MMKLYHWTCLDHGSPKIMETGVVVPKDQPLLGVRLSWWSHIPFASREQLGLSSAMLRCDRMGQQFVAEVESSQVMTWTAFRTELIRQRSDVAPIARALEAAHGARPGFWWVAPEPIEVAMVLEHA